MSSGWLIIVVWLLTNSVSALFFLSQGSLPYPLRVTQIVTGVAVGLLGVLSFPLGLLMLRVAVRASHEQSNSKIQAT